MSYQLVFERRYSMAHRLISGASPKCAVPHGHNEYVKVTLRSKTSEALDGNFNMVTSFEKAKKRWHHFIDNAVDHCLQLSAKDALVDFFVKNEPEKLPRLMITQGDPTTETLCAVFMSKLQCFLKAENPNLECVEVCIEETPTNTVVLSGVDAHLKHLNIDSKQQGDGKDEEKFWWNRNDFTINDLSPVSTTTAYASQMTKK